ncbi:MAG: ABC transporter permease [Bacteroidota bacterium]
MHLILTLIKESFIFAITSLYANKLRTFLSLLGISIGIFAIISVFTITDSLENNIKGSISSLGENVIFIQKWPWSFGSDYPWWKYMNRPNVTIEEEKQVKKKSKLAQAVCFVANGSKSVKYKTNNVENADFVLAGHEYEKIKSFELAEGRYFSESESATGKNLCIIGSTIAEALFGEQYPIGKQVFSGGRKLTVLGVFAKEGSSIVGNSSDNQILVPINFARNIVDLRSERLNPTINVKAKEGISNDELMNELNGIMRNIRKIKPSQEESFALNETNLLSQGFQGLFLIIGITGWIIGGFSILVGGFGIANIMFVSVKERTNQIGIQKALGAKNYFILLQFLIESVVLSLIGGAFGLLIIFSGTLLVATISDFDISLNASNVILGFTISFIIGIVSGIVPSYSASKLDPVEAMRY